VGFWSWWAPVFAADVQVVGTTSYDSNVYEALRDAQGGLTSRVSVTAKGLGYRGSKSAVQIEQQAGFKHIWATAPGQMQAGDVFVEQFFVNGLRSIGQKSTVAIRSGLKFKQATRAPGEESYLRAVVDGDLTVPFGLGMTSRLRLGLGGDDSRDVLLPETTYHTAGIDLTYSRKRHFSAHARFLKRWTDFDRAALDLDDLDQIVPLKGQQVDRATSLTLGFQVFTGMLIQADYVLLRNQSNSFGYAFWAHRLQGMVVRHLGRGVDAQVLAQFHVRLYDEKVPDLFGRAAETDAYEQSIAILKLSRQISAKHVLAGQYGFYRNGAREGDGFYRKHVFSLMFEVKM
jgi:hypothetical protein